MNLALRVCILKAVLLSFIVFNLSLTDWSITYFIMINGFQLPKDTLTGPPLVFYKESNPRVERLVQDYGIETGLALIMLTELGIYFALFLSLNIARVFYLKDPEMRALDPVVAVLNLGVAIWLSLLRLYYGFKALIVLPQLFQHIFLILFVVLPLAWILHIRFYWKSKSINIHSRLQCEVVTDLSEMNGLK